MLQKETFLFCLCISFMCVCAHVCVCACVVWDTYVTTYRKNQSWLLSFKSELLRVLRIQRGPRLFESPSDKQIFKCKQYWRDCFRRWSVAWHLEENTAGPAPAWLTAETGATGSLGQAHTSSSFHRLAHFLAEFTGKIIQGK